MPLQKKKKHDYLNNKGKGKKKKERKETLVAQ